MDNLVVRALTTGAQHLDHGEVTGGSRLLPPQPCQSFLVVLSLRAILVKARVRDQN